MLFPFVPPIIASSNESAAPRVRLFSVALAAPAGLRPPNAELPRAEPTWFSSSWSPPRRLLRLSREDAGVCPVARPLGTLPPLTRPSWPPYPAKGLSMEEAKPRVGLDLKQRVPMVYPRQRHNNSRTTTAKHDVSGRVELAARKTLVLTRARPCRNARPGGAALEGQEDL